MNRFSSQDERQLLSLVREVQAHISAGDSPDDAIVKTASANRVHPDMLPLLVQTCNTGRQAYQQEKCGQSGGALCLVNEFPLANLDNVKAALYPAQPRQSLLLKSAAGVSDVYDRPPADRVERPVRTKAACRCEASPPPPPGDPLTAARWREGIKMAAARAVDEAKVATIVARDRFVARLQALHDYFKQAAECRLSLAEVEFNSRQLLGPAVEPLFEQLHGSGKQASAPPHAARPVNLAQAPYSLVKAALDAADAWRDAVANQTIIQTKTAAAREKLAAFSAGETASGSPCQAASSPLSKTACSCGCTSKAASWLNPMLTGASAGLASNLKSKSDPSLITSKMENQLDDPEHLEELRAIESRAMLTDLMNNDEVLSGYDPDEITEAYNELVQLSPHAATRPALMRPLLRKRLTAGGVEQFDAQQIAEIEKTLQQTRMPPAAERTPNGKSPVLV